MTDNLQAYICSLAIHNLLFWNAFSSLWPIYIIGLSFIIYWSVEICIYYKRNILFNIHTVSEKAGLKLNIQKLRSCHPVPSLHGKWTGNSDRLYFLGLHKIKRCLLLGRKFVTNLQCIKKSKDITLLTKVCIVKTGFSSSHVWRWELDHKEGWASKNWCFWTVVLEKTLESPLDCKIKSVNLKGNQLWILIGRTDAEAEAPTFRPPDLKSQLIGKDPDARKDWGKEEKGMTEDEIVG